MSTDISWTNETWNPVTGCDRVSAGCDNCYALNMAARLKAMGQPKYQTDGDPRTSGPGFGVAVHPEALTIPYRWRKPRRVFVNSMGDLFHEDVPDGFIGSVFDVMALTPQHTYQVLTKRHARMRSLITRWQEQAADRPHAGASFRRHDMMWSEPRLWPLPNVWLGVSVEDQKWADIRIPALLGTPAAVRFLSCEPLLGPVDLHWCGGLDALERDWCGGPGGGTGAPHPLVDWVIAGGESGRGFRTMDVRWLTSIVDQCRDAGVPVFVKQDSNRSDGHQGRIPDDYWVHQFPQPREASVA
jgi:protein gp37